MVFPHSQKNDQVPEHCLIYWKKPVPDLHWNDDVVDQKVDCFAVGVNETDQLFLHNLKITRRT